MDYRQLTNKEKKWIESFKRVMKKAPDTLFLFAGRGTVDIYAKDENNERYMTKDGSVDADAPGDSAPSAIESDGGGY